ncbi:hypothetical protein FQR65_LT15297 [Abscondita terminalis]|nr:hypothetical protein FQR65_LT15297 [Abscondita terminalis]
MSNAAGNKSKSNTQDKNNDMWIPDMDMGNGLSDINPELEYREAGNGVILITTKTGKKKGGGVGITYSTSMGFESMFIKPDLQSSFGRGSNGLPYPADSKKRSWEKPYQGQVYDNLAKFLKGRRWTSDVKFQYISARANNRPVSGMSDGGNLYPDVVLMPMNIDIRDYKKGQMEKPLAFVQMDYI